MKYWSVFFVIFLQNFCQYSTFQWHVCKTLVDIPWIVLLSSVQYSSGISSRHCWVFLWFFCKMLVSFSVFLLQDTWQFSCNDCLIGLVVEASASGAEDPCFDSCLHRGDFSGSCHASDLKIGIPMATLPGAWPYRVSAWTGWPGVSMPWWGEVEVWSAASIPVWQHVKLVWADLTNKNSYNVCAIHWSVLLWCFCVTPVNIL